MPHSTRTKGSVTKDFGPDVAPAILRHWQTSKFDPGVLPVTDMPPGQNTVFMPWEQKTCVIRTELVKHVVLPPNAKPQDEVTIWKIPAGQVAVTSGTAVMIDGESVVLMPDAPRCCWVLYFDGIEWLSTSRL